MTIQKAFQDYVDKKATAIDVINLMTGIINPDHAVDICALINQITRVEKGEMEIEIFKEMHGLT